MDYIYLQIGEKGGKQRDRTKNVVCSNVKRFPLNCLPLYMDWPHSVRILLVSLTAIFLLRYLECGFIMTTILLNQPLMRKLGSIS